MTNKKIIQALRETAALIELTDGNPFRARAFSRAARSLRGLDTPITERLAAGTLTEIDGIGEGLAGDIQELVDRGSLPTRDELLNIVPPGVLDLLQIKGLGTKRVRTLWQSLEVTSLDELEAAAETGRVAALDGFGPKTEAKIIRNIRQLRRYQSQRRYADAHAEVTPLLEQLRAHDAVARAEATGALRRNLPTLSRAELIVTGDDRTDLQHVLTEMLDDASVRTDATPPMVEGALAEGLPLRIWLVSPDAFGTEQWRHTGSNAHCEAFIERFGSPAPHATEADLFEAVGLAPIPPELREHQGELDAAAQEALPTLITTDDLRGSLHNHSTYSDGAHSLRAMAEAARAMGLSYFGICDHSQSLTIASGLSPEDVTQQREEVAALNAEFAQDEGPPFRIFHGIESDILKDGSLDYEDDVLAAFDFIVASVHSGFNMTEDEATERLIRAIQHPYTSILGHPTGRLLLVREGYTIDHERVIEACAIHNVAIELNANPYRLDMDWRWIRTATDRGVLISINPDAHATDELANVRWGVAAARKGWLPPAQCLNAKSLDAFSQWLQARRTTQPA